MPRRRRVKAEPMTKERALKWVASERGGAGLTDAKRAAEQAGATVAEIQEARRTRKNVGGGSSH